MHRALTLGAAALLFSNAACDNHVEAATPNGGEPPRPKVTVATPLPAQVSETADYVSRTEAPRSVDIRARVSGVIVRAPLREGELVKAGALLFVIDPRPFEVALQRARAELAIVNADLELAKRNVERAGKLRQASAIPERDFDSQSAQVTALEARRDAALAAIAAAQLDLDYAYVRSPVAGRVGRKLVSEGNLVGPSTPSPLTTVVSVDPLYVYLDVEEKRGLRVRPGRDLHAHLGFPGEEGYPHEAQVDFVDNHVDPGSGTIKVRAVVPNPDGKLTHGLFARAQLPLGAPRPSLLISDRAVATDQDRRFVWVVDGAGKVEYRPVKLGPLHDGLRVVEDGLRADERVVVRGLLRVKPGALVAPELIPMREVDGSTEQASR